jgi:hypothetical protein
MAALEEESARLVQMAWAPRTLQMFEVGMSNFRKFRVAIQSPHANAPASPTEVKHFVAFLSLKKMSPSTINSYVCAVSNWHKVQGLDDPCADFLVRKALKGAARAGVSPDTRQPITPDLLLKLLTVLPIVCMSLYEAKMFTSVFTLAFFGLFRIGELVCQNKTFADKNALQFQDVLFQNELMKITIRFSKTDQLGRSNNIILQGDANSKLCPVKAMKDFINFRGCHNGPMFCHFGKTFLSRYQFNRVLELSMKRADPSIKNVKSHSFRIGGATNAICKGVPYEKVKEMGRWKSDAAKTYIRTPIIEVNVLT